MDGVPLELPLPHQQLAELAGCTAEQRVTDC
jgi:hypothetical protein